MQRLLSKDWSMKFNWGKPARFAWRSPAVNEYLWNSTSVRDWGQIFALPPPLPKTFFEPNHTTMHAFCFFSQQDLPNHVVLRREIGETQRAPLHVTTFYVMRCRSASETPPAMQRMPMSTATMIVDIVTADGEELARLLQATKI
eukprot:4364100-Amphidinium_carterae.1